MSVGPCILTLVHLPLSLGSSTEFHVEARENTTTLITWQTAVLFRDGNQLNFWS
jgi:hypothetical protein